MKGKHRIDKSPAISRVPGGSPSRRGKEEGIGFGGGTMLPRGLGIHATGKGWGRKFRAPEVKRKFQEGKRPHCKARSK